MAGAAVAVCDTGRNRERVCRRLCGPVPRIQPLYDGVVRLLRPRRGRCWRPAVSPTRRSSLDDRPGLSAGGCTSSERRWTVSTLVTIDGESDRRLRRARGARPLRPARRAARRVEARSDRRTVGHSGSGRRRRATGSGPIPPPRPRAGNCGQYVVAAPADERMRTKGVSRSDRTARPRARRPGTRPASSRRLPSGCA